MRNLDLVVAMINNGIMAKDQGISLLMDLYYQKELELEEVRDLIDSLVERKAKK